MPVPKRYFCCSQEIVSDPEVWELIKEFGDRSILTWLQILIYLDRTQNAWRVTGDWLAVLSRSVRQSSANLRRQLGWMTAKGWLHVGEVAADGSPLLFNSPNWLKYNRSREHKGNSIIPDQGAVDAPLLSFPTPTPTPTPKEKEKTPIVPKGDDEFDVFWKMYPKKVGKKAAWNVWRKATDKPGIDVILSALAAQQRQDQWVKDGGAYIPHPSTWLNQGRWNDEPLVPIHQPRKVCL